MDHNNNLSPESYPIQNSLKIFIYLFGNMKNQYQYAKDRSDDGTSYNDINHIV
jgi:hypothetical protein